MDYSSQNKLQKEVDNMIEKVNRSNTMLNSRKHKFIIYNMLYYVFFTVD